ncbi:hypothetical protein ACFY8W_23235 [Streptomyces sp. NPDC012637]
MAGAAEEPGHLVAASLPEQQERLSKPGVKPPVTSYDEGDASKGRQA